VDAEEIVSDEDLCLMLLLWFNVCYQILGLLPPFGCDMVQKMVNGAKVTSWTCVSFSTRIDRGLPQEFCKQLIGMCVSKGMVCLVSCLLILVTISYQKIY